MARSLKEPTRRRDAGDEETADRTPAGSGPGLLLARIVKRWDGAPAPVLDGVTLAADRGSVVGVSGRNGAGKTTLLRIAAGLILPDAGEVSLGGLDPERDRTAFQRRLGFVAAGNSGLYGRLRVEDHLEFWARLALMPRARRGGAIEAALDAFALRELCGRRVDRLSMGQRQRLRLALAFLHEPDVVLLDEPTSSLDREAVALLDAQLRALRARGGTAVVCAPTGERWAVRCDREYEVAGGGLEATR
jgi:ABC-type multidrug transport system ATPase subunit